LSLVALGGERGRDVGAWVVGGALLPDAPMFLFFFWERFVAGASQEQIWGELYFEPGWQAFFDAFNSIPLAVGVGLVAWRLGKRGLQWGAASVVLHCCADLALHREDAHRHFYPLSDWRFESPISYWDPVHYGALGAGLETLVVWIGTGMLWQRVSGRASRVTLALTCVLYGVVYIGFYARRWLG
jgi:hypothetical protein